MTILLVLGGARSGKSRHAEAWAMAAAGDRPIGYVATAQALDDEMAARIAHHAARRGDRWRLHEAPIDLPGAIAAAATGTGAVLVDCLTLWLTNLMLGGHAIAAGRNALIAAIGACPVPLALVANEVGLGIVPDNALARQFRDEAGWLNQAVAQAADRVVFVAAGLPLVLKGMP